MITHAVALMASYQTLFRFLSDVRNGTTWSFITMDAIVEDTGGWWTASTADGRVRVRALSDERQGLIEHQFAFLDSQWTVPMSLRSIGPTRCLLVAGILHHRGSVGPDLYEARAQLVHYKLALLRNLVDAQAKARRLAPGRDG